MVKVSKEKRVGIKEQLMGWEDNYELRFFLPK